ncbi:MAG: glycoside hydrolase family 3 C-terminal domain-containing protein [Bacteroidales bacterium]|nr:glycoside hydrolase family 3 C-terminal domain-containing protein [Bacteroidales bacterium]
MKRISILFLLVCITFMVKSQNQTIDQKVDSLLQLMTLDEKIGQMTQAERGELENITDISTYALGSLLSGGGSAPSPNTAASWASMYNQYQAQALQSRLGIPMIYGVDAVHGHNNVAGAVLFPHNIGMGCTWDTTLVKAANQITAREVAATGIDWTFSPCIAVVRNERWGRTYEGFGETPEIQQLMAKASVAGLQGNDLGNPETILACAKHYLGDGGTTNGTDQGNTVVNEALLREIHLPGYADAIGAGVGTVMASYSSWNGVKMHGNGYLLTTVLKNEMNFGGFIISDWKGVDQITEDYRTAVKRSVNAGMDMVMVPDRYIYFISILKDLVQTGEVSLERIDDAVRRILKQKFLLRLFEEPYADNSLLSSVGSAAHRTIARQAVRESLVLLTAKNDVLPINKTDQKILVAGSIAANLGAQCGGWSISWQGSDGNITTGTTILAGIQQLAAPGQVIYSPTGTTTENVDVAVVVIGEHPYAEGAGDRTSLNIATEDVNLIKSLKEKGIPVIVILVSGRPMIVGELLPYTDAFLAAWLPGTEGDGIAQVLFGDYQPSGKLTHTWPRTMSQVPINFGDADYNPLFEYKHGLQVFPSVATSEMLLPYAALLKESGDQVVLSLSGSITGFNATAQDFSLKVNGVLQSGIISGIAISPIDSSMLEISLNQPLDAADADVSISYTGTGITSQTLTLGIFSDFFVYNAIANYGAPVTVPGKVEAENYYEMSGVGTEPCTDIGGGLNVGWIENGDYMKYFIRVQASGNYQVSARIAGFNSGNLNLLFNETLTGQIAYSATNGWQSWQDFNTTIYLDAGDYVMKAFAYTDGFNINYFNFTQLTGISENQPGIASINLYPNPVIDDFQLNFYAQRHQEIKIGLFDMSGKQVQSLFKGAVNQGQNEFLLKLDSKLSEGMYFIEIKDENTRYFRKLLISKL